MAKAGNPRKSQRKSMVVVYERASGEIVHIHECLWDREGQSTLQLISLDGKIREMLTLFKQLWADLSKSDCRFPKFHYTLHLTSIVEEFGSMRVVDTCQGENKNKLVKKLYKRTNRKRRDMEIQMFRVSAIHDGVLAEGAMYGMYNALMLLLPRFNDRLKLRMFREQWFDMLLC